MAPVGSVVSGDGRSYREIRTEACLRGDLRKLFSVFCTQKKGGPYPSKLILRGCRWFATLAGLNLQMTVFRFLPHRLGPRPPHNRQTTGT